MVYLPVLMLFCVCFVCVLWFVVVKLLLCLIVTFASILVLVILLDVSSITICVVSLGFVVLQVF